MSGQPAINKPKSSVLVVADCQDRQQLEQVPGNRYQLTYTCDQQGITAINPDEFDHIVLATLPNSLLSALAIGLERGSEGWVIVESLLLGKQYIFLRKASPTAVIVRRQIQLFTSFLPIKKRHCLSLA